MVPLRALSAYTSPFWEPKNSLSPSSSGEDSLGAGRPRDQRVLPLAVFSAHTRPGDSPWALERTVAYTVLAFTAGEDAESWPSDRDQMTWPLCLSLAVSTPLSASWKMWVPYITGGNSSREPTLCAHTCLKGGCTRVGAGKKRVWFFV